MKRVLAGLVLAVAIGGCGGENESTPTTTTGAVEDVLPFAETTAASTSPSSAPATTAAPTTTPPTAPTTRATAAPTTRATTPSTTAAPVTQPATTAPPSPSVYYANCAAARAAGAAPVYRGDPGYGSHLDRDGDGVGCE